MHPLRALPAALAWTLALATPLVAQAQADHSAPHAPAAAAPNTASDASAAQATLPWAEAEVRRVDLQTGKIGLRHGPIANLDMPPMSMVFQVADPALLQGLRPGDRVRFTADQLNGQYTVLQLEPVR